MDWVQTIGTLAGMLVGFFTIWWRLDSKLERKFDTLETRFERKLDTLETKFEHKFDILETKFDRQFDTLETKFEHKFDILETKFDRQFDTLDSKIDTLNAFLRDTLLEFKSEIGELKGVARTPAPAQD